MYRILLHTTLMNNEVQRSKSFHTAVTQGEEIGVAANVEVLADDLSVKGPDQ